MRSVGFLAAAAVLAAGSWIVAACSGSSVRSGFNDGADGSVGPGTNADGSSGPIFGNNNADAAAGCNGIGCNAVLCGGGAHTTITGQVMDPAGKNPLYNVIVYIPPDPTAPLPALTKGVSCDKCGAVALNPVVSTLTDEDGKFTLTDVPVMKGVPIVVQVGKWRKEITFDVDTKCEENPLTAPITLPKNGTEGDMPQIAVSQGALDALECLIRGIGVDDSEFVAGAQPTGHVHLYKGLGGGGMTGATVPDATALWNTADATGLGAYDIVGLSCEGQEYYGSGTNKSTAAMQAMHDYAEAGGRIFATHYHYVWFEYNPQADFKGVANWNAGFADEEQFPVVTTFPKGLSFSKWLTNVNASSDKGVTVDLNSDDVTDSLSTVSSTTQAWITGSKNSSVNTSDVKYFSFNAPISAAPADQCGRAVFGDIHVSGDTGGEVFPGGCPAIGTDLTPQQKALEFMFFDLSSCVQSDSTPPTPPK